MPARRGRGRRLQGQLHTRHQLIEIPTGLGKTAAVVLAWLWNRTFVPQSIWARRLVYCLPMRTLVEQTRDNCKEWLRRLAAEYAPNAKPEENELAWLAKYSPFILMGGEDAGEWDIYPECPAILIGTQEMLLSRALNRGYGMSRYRWPMHFGLLNNDALWVMDETQLMGVGVETSAQLDGFRCDGKMPTVGACPTWWMSATREGPRGPSWLARAIALRDRLGPFKLAYLETVLRAADARGSHA